ncbi:hypothetical protein AGMMS49938_14970 [Fibrobacterales bacterium]|nr:hypothetical protein AGMMS49938_14970 [Fibrobacterales bacterium]
MLFGDKRNVNILKDFLEAVLHLEPNVLKTIILRDPYLKKEYVEDKLSILDVKAELLDGKIVDIEIQVKNIPEMRSRVTYYNASMITEQIGEGGKYMDIKPAISIIITNYPFVTESKKCHTTFQMLEKTERFQFNDLQEINVLDLTKIAAEKDEVLFNWLEFIKAEKEKDIETSTNLIPRLVEVSKRHWRTVKSLVLCEFAVASKNSGLENCFTEGVFRGFLWQ